jgi:hypothetical protein
MKTSSGVQAGEQFLGLRGIARAQHALRERLHLGEVGAQDAAP